MLLVVNDAGDNVGNVCLLRESFMSMESMAVYMVFEEH